jgi:hypothetical protein
MNLIINKDGNKTWIYLPPLKHLPWQQIILALVEVFTWVHSFPFFFGRGNRMSIQPSNQRVLVIWRRTSQYLKFWQNLIKLCRLQLSELWAFHRNATLSQNTALSSDGLGRFNVVT